MAHYVQIPKDLNDIKQKFMFNLTKRQVVSFSIGFATGVPLFFLTRNIIGLSGGIILMGCCAAPALICGLYQRNGMYFEQVIKNMFRFFRKPKKRVYRTTNLFECIERQLEYDKLRRLLRKIDGGKR